MTTVYLAGAINQMSDKDCMDWRKEATEKLRVDGYFIKDPMNRDYRGKEELSFREIVEGDKKDIDNSDIILVNYIKPSVGTSMEILYAWERNKIIVIFTQDQNYSPWLKYHSNIIIKTLDEAITFLRGLYIK